jgi:hypothetical protein
MRSGFGFVGALRAPSCLSLISEIGVIRGDSSATPAPPLQIASADHPLWV